MLTHLSPAEMLYKISGNFIGYSTKTATGVS